MTEDKGRPENGGDDGNAYGDGGSGAAGDDRQGFGQDPYGQQGFGQQGHDRNQYGHDQRDPNQYGQDPYGQQGYGQQGYQGYQGDQGYQGYQAHGGYPNQDGGQWGPGQGQGQWGQPQGQWGQQGYGDPGVGVSQPGGELPPTSPVISGPAPFNITRPLSVAFKRVNDNIGPWLGFAAAAIAALVVVTGIFMAIIFGGLASSLSGFDPVTGTTPNPGGFFAVFGGLLFMYPVLFAVAFVISVFSYRGAFEEIDGRKPAFGTFFRVTRWGSLLGTWLLTGLIVVAAMIPGYALMFIGFSLSTQSEGAGMAIVMLSYVVLIAGALVVSPITALMPMLVMDGRAKALESPAAAWGLIKGRFWSVLAAMLLAGLVGAIGIMLCYIGAIYTLPIQMVAYVDIYRQLVGGRRPVQVA